MNVNKAIDDLYTILNQHNGEYMDYASYEAAVDNLNIISNFVAGTRWISMNDHLPDDSELVMLFAPAGTYTNFDWYDFGIYQKASNSFLHIGFPLRAQCPTSTHWMPLPEPPKEVE